jgi:hypothetical protein
LRLPSRSYSTEISEGVLDITAGSPLAHEIAPADAVQIATSRQKV